MAATWALPSSLAFHRRWISKKIVECTSEIKTPGGRGIKRERKWVPLGCGVRVVPPFARSFLLSLSCYAVNLA